MSAHSKHTEALRVGRAKIWVRDNGIGIAEDGRS